MRWTVIVEGRQDYAEGNIKTFHIEADTSKEAYDAACQHEAWENITVDAFYPVNVFHGWLVDALNLVHIYK